MKLNRRQSKIYAHIERFGLHMQLKEIGVVDSMETEEVTS